MHTITSADGTLIAYDRTGAGPALVLVGGAFSYLSRSVLVTWERPPAEPPA